MKVLDTKKMACCEDVILPKVNTHQEPYMVSWKCPKCGEVRQQIICGIDLLVLEIAESIDANKAFPNS